MLDKNITFYPILLREPVNPEDAGKVDVADLILSHFDIQDRDIVIVTSKVVSILEGRCIKLDSVVPSKKSLKIAEVYGKNPGLIELINQEGKVFCVSPGGRLLRKKRYKDILLSLAKPDLTEEQAEKIMNFSYSMRWMVKMHGYLADNAGIDCQNVPEGYAVLLPKDPRKSADTIREKILERTGKKVAVIITDSLGGGAVLGNWDVPLGYSGMDPVERNWGCQDVFGRIGTGGGSNYIIPIASMGGIVMGNSDERTPITVLRGFAYKDERPEDIGKNILTFPSSYTWEGLFWIIVESIRYFFIRWRA
jgi:coenzyme F420-0:L-glutamate ligase / coenzyme F420-1:gamma-L-glutamate ligase